MAMHQIQDLFPLMTFPRKIWMTTHYRPDGDAVGSVLALKHYLESLGHSVTAVLPSSLPGFLNWLPGVESLINYEAGGQQALKALEEADFIFGLDFNHFSRTRYMEEAMEKAPGLKVLIDHHLYPGPGWDYGISIPQKSSTAEMVYDFILLHGGQDRISPEIATCLYTGVMTDTGSFRFELTSASVHDMVADLKRRGLEHSRVHEYVYDSWSLNRLRFLGHVLLNKMEIYPEYRAGLIALSRQEMKSFEVQPGDLEGLVNYPLSIEGIQFSTLITEKGEEVRLSFRSKGTFNVNQFARRHFEGGGHFHAAGGQSALELDATISRFKEILSDIHPR